MVPVLDIAEPVSLSRLTMFLCRTPPVSNPPMINTSSWSSADSAAEVEGLGDVWSVPAVPVDGAAGFVVATDPVVAGFPDGLVPRGDGFPAALVSVDEIFPAGLVTDAAGVAAGLVPNVAGFPAGLVPNVAGFAVGLVPDVPR
jgi:hypothetical protein